MVSKTISIWGRNLDAWNHERSWKVISASQCTSACTIARRDTLVALTGPGARWMTSECFQTVRWRLTRMKFCRCHCFNDWNQLVSTAVLFHNADKCWCCCLITTLTTAQLCWWCCNDALIDSCVFWAHRDSETSNAYDLGTGHLYVALLLTRHVVEHNTPACVASTLWLVCVVATHSMHRHLY